MYFAMVLLKLAEWLVYQLLANSCYSAAMKVKIYGFFLRKPSLRSQHQPPQNFYPSVTKCGLQNRGSQTLVCDIECTLLRLQSFFPYFMLVAFEGGSILSVLAAVVIPIPLFFGLQVKVKGHDFHYILWAEIKGHGECWKGSVAQVFS